MDEVPKNKKVLITGATGFVGQYLLKFLEEKEFLVFGTSFPENPQPWQKNIIYLDLRQEKEVYELIRRLKPDWIFHLAAMSNVGQSWEKRREVMETNVMGYFYLLEACRRFQPQARLLYVSSSDVYGFTGADNSNRALNEEAPLRLINPYAFTKACGEGLSRFYFNCEGLQIVIARSFPHTGPGQSSDFVCSDWARQIARIEVGLAEPEIKVGNINLERDYSDVRDVVRAYFLLMLKGRAGEIYNVCSGRTVKLKEILELLLSLSNLQVKIVVDEKRIRRLDIDRLAGDNRKIKEETGWQPEIPLEKTLRDLLHYWRERERIRIIKD
ncbi:MAG: GDP-mannose 4,6-dehydratase [Candidatus Aminicenantes bacterium]|nr:GDP-mannose 4,6-dehydratase [Candidatus Aminicenantes bacterium]